MLMDFESYIKQIIYSCPYNITFSGNKCGFLNRWLVTGKDAQSHGDKSLEPYIGTDATILYNAQHTELAQEELESNWRYYCCTKLDDDTQIEYCRNNPEQMFSKDRDAYIYCLCCIYCEDEQDYLFFVDPQIPIRIWINGLLVFAVTSGYMINKYTFAIRLSKGINSILVEKEMLKLFRGFSPYTSRFHMEFVPIRVIVESDIRQFYDRNQFKILEKEYKIIPDRAFFDGREDISITVVPRYITDIKPERITVSIFDASLRKIIDTEGYTFRRLLLKPDGEIRGTLLIEVKSHTGSKKAGAYVFKGDFSQHLKQLGMIAEKRKDYHSSIFNFIKRASEIPDANLFFFRNTLELMTEHIYESVLKQLFAVEGAVIYCDENCCEKTILSISEKRALVFKDSETDDKFTAYLLHLPRDYSLNKRYALTVYFIYGTGYSTYPYAMDFIERQLFDGTIVLTICGRGGMNRDYINEGDILTIIKGIVEKYNIDRDRIFCIGGCTGTLRAIGMGIRMPGLFAGIMGVEGTARLDIRKPELEYLKNLDNLRILQLNNIEDAIFNTARVLDTLNRFRHNKSWNFSGFSHIQFDTMLSSSKLIKILLGIKRERYPKEIFFITDEPIYNKSYWIRLDYIESLEDKARIEATISGAKLICISCSNVKSLTLLLAREEMGLEDSINISINGYSCNVYLGEYSESSITLRSGGISIENRSLTRDSFAKEYDCFQINERLLGIKRVYGSRCTVIKPCSQERKSLSRRMFLLLKDPMREKVRNYKYGVLTEDELRHDKLEDTSLVYIIAPDTVGGNVGTTGKEIREELLKGSGVSMSGGCMEYRGKKYCGDYFALIRSDSPFNGERSVLLAICSTGEAMTQMAGLLSSFDYSPVFYNDAIVYSSTGYEYFR
ncbi:hypothetical protein DFR58_12166 [Anaerobacterium chartisolvens]|uniref:Uncharacterized protein n=1 Tax=Anaerobacterium chartisolvens TaxID=1297424 RepID=A0A369AT62_9FIRM|nr:hypothetical protein [Anaerobacterium chartisolvens]RCX12562.1 hypothetical protein DFR58_12166 [Anaerobacterium chartisolvens]